MIFEILLGLVGIIIIGLISFGIGSLLKRIFYNYLYNLNGWKILGLGFFLFFWVLLGVLICWIIGTNILEILSKIY